MQGAPTPQDAAFCLSSTPSRRKTSMSSGLFVIVLAIRILHDLGAVLYNTPGDFDAILWSEIWVCERLCV